MDSSSIIDYEHSVLFEREQFFSTYLRYQTWSLPDSVIYYISKNPSNSKIYEKMIQSCKYFFIKNPLLVASDFHIKYKNNQWNTYLNGKNVDLNRILCKLWITDEIFIENHDTPKIPSNSLLSTILSKIFQSDVKELNIQKQKLFINDLKFLAASKCDDVTLNETMVINDDGTIVGMENIFEVCPKIKVFHYSFSQNLGGPSQNVITPKTVQKLIQIPHFSNFKYCCMSEIPEIFDIDTFYDYIKTNDRTRFYLKFGNELSQEYRNRLQTIINEIIAAQHHDYKVPFIQFSGNDFSSSKTLYKLFKP